MLGSSSVRHVSFAAALGVAILLPASPVPCRAEDSDRTRYYLGFRGRDTDDLTGVHDLWGVSLGANLGRHLGAELSGDVYELFLDVPERGTIGEYGVLLLVPQLRLRYPLFGGRLTPYALAGAGVGLTQFNDRKRPGFGLSIETEDTTLVGVVGGGIEYFLADNVAVGIEGRYVFARDQTLRVQGRELETSVEAALITLGLRIFVPELRPARLAESRARVPTRLYFGARFGGAKPVQTRIFPELRARPEPPATGGWNQFFALSVGANFGRYFGVEIPLEGYETRLDAPGVGSIGEYALTTVIPSLRLRYPLRGGRLVPYALAGVGVGFAEFNDGRLPGLSQRISAKNFAPVGALGAGVEYFVASNVAFGLEAKYVISRGHTVTVDGREQTGNLDAVYLSFGLRVYLTELGG